jgi:tellurite resistance protein TerC
LESNPALKWLRRHLRMSDDYDGERLTTRVDGVRVATPLAVVIVLIGIVDLIFAVDSIPAIFAITTDTFIVLTSNVFAILGLRAMYFLLAGMQERFHLLSYGLAIILFMIGLKMLLIDVVKVPVVWSLAATVSILIATILLSLALPAREGVQRGAYPFTRKKQQPKE